MAPPIAGLQLAIPPSWRPPRSIPRSHARTERHCYKGPSTLVTMAGAVRFESGSFRPLTAAAPRRPRSRPGDPGCRCPGWPARAGPAAASRPAGSARASPRGPARRPSTASLSAPARPGLAPGAGDREERHERDALLAAGAQQLVVPSGRELDAEPVLHADHRRDRPEPRPGAAGLIAGQAQMADQPGVAQLGQRAEVLGDRVRCRTDAQVHHVEVVAAELAQVLLDLAAQLFRPGPGQPLPRRVAARPDLGGDDQVVGVGGERAC